MREEPLAAARTMLGDRHVGRCHAGRRPPGARARRADPAAQGRPAHRGRERRTPPARPRSTVRRSPVRGGRAGRRGSDATRSRQHRHPALEDPRGHPPPPRVQERHRAPHGDPPRRPARSPPWSRRAARPASAVACPSQGSARCSPGSPTPVEPNRRTVDLVGMEGAPEARRPEQLLPARQDGPRLGRAAEEGEVEGLTGVASRRAALHEPRELLSPPGVHDQREPGGRDLPHPAERVGVESGVLGHGRSAVGAFAGIGIVL